MKKNGNIGFVYLQTWLHAMHSTAISGEWTWLNCVKKKAGPKNPIDCMICRFQKVLNQQCKKITSNDEDYKVKIMKQDASVTIKVSVHKQSKQITRILTVEKKL